MTNDLDDVVKKTTVGCATVAFWIIFGPLLLLIVLVGLVYLGVAIGEALP